MTPSQLKYEVEAAGHERHFFDRKTVTVPLPKGRGFPLHTEHTYARTKA